MERGLKSLGLAFYHCGEIQKALEWFEKDLETLQ